MRVEQELQKRSDLLRHRMGFQSRPIDLEAKLGMHPGHFFFASSDASERADMVRTNLPAESAAILQEADNICEHRFHVLGYHDLSFTLAPRLDIDWHLDPVHGKRAPLEPWFKIPFLDFAIVGDHKVTWELNRHQHLVALAKAWLLRGDEKYTRELIAQWHQWMEANPYPLGINWGSTLEVAFRSLSWIWVDQLLAGSPTCEAFRAELKPALAFHGRYIERFLSTYFSPNTHLLGEAVALFYLGTLYPQMPRATEWKRSGWEIVLHEAGRQVRPDGVYFEQSLHYHVYALDFFLHARLLAARNSMAIPAAYDGVLDRMLAVVAALSQSGPAEGFGDDDGGRLWNPRRNSTEQLTDPLAIGALMYSQEFGSAQLTEEAIWLFGDQAVNKLPSSPRRSPPKSRAFPDGGLYVLADSEPCTQTMMVDAGPQGIGRSGHGHADALSLRLTMDGRRWLVDSGSGVYISNDLADRNAFRGTGAHNTMRVDALDQAVPSEPFSWTHIPSPKTEDWIAGNTFTYFVGSHDGYCRLADPVLHRRHVLKITGGPWLVRDIALGRAEHELEVRWHFAPDLDVQSASQERIQVLRSGAVNDEFGLILLIPEETAWKAEISRTLLSPAYGALQPAPLLRVHAQVALPAELATMILPHRAVVRSDEPRLASMAQPAVQVYELDYHRASEGFFFSLGDDAWSFGPWSSDARVLYCRVEDEKLTHLVLLGATRVDWQGQQILLAPKRGTFEWRKQDALINAGEFSITPYFEELTGSSRSSASPSSYAEKH